MKNNTLVIICVDNIDRARLRERKHANIAISILLLLIIPKAIKRKDCEKIAHEEYAKRISFGDILIS